MIWNRASLFCIPVIFYLRRLPHGSVPAPSYYPRLFSALDYIVKESFDEEFRKVAIILGLVESLAELLVLELAVFDIPARNEHRSLRKLIANALTNLTYGHAASKRRLCFYSGFIPTVVRILNEARNLAQLSYAIQGYCGKGVRFDVYAKENAVCFVYV
ncbi:unnamed protein product [Strongylus vulgaris]|uniref:Uncharacterized protein n=1 Tax=Strongylus vulgaris TaxID=40348 RepID=A0A3P7KWM7_STRVU|nr:unnamed protein product [Strongylus vulgaris]